MSYVVDFDGGFKVYDVTQDGPVPIHPCLACVVWGHLQSLLTSNERGVRHVVHKNIKPQDWVEIKYNGVTYLVAVSTLLRDYIATKEQDIDNWDWLSIRDRFDTLSWALEVPPDSHVDLALELRSMANWIEKQ